MVTLAPAAILEVNMGSSLSTEVLLTMSKRCSSLADAACCAGNDDGPAFQLRQFLVGNFLLNRHDEIENAKFKVYRSCRITL